jgi:hypothetical protein
MMGAFQAKEFFLQAYEDAIRRRAKYASLPTAA